MASSHGFDHFFTGHDGDPAGHNGHPACAAADDLRAVNELLNVGGWLRSGRLRRHTACLFPGVQQVLQSMLGGL